MVDPLPKVSFVIPTYNSKSTLETCLRSIIAQTYLNKEIIVVDGGSRDGTLNVVKSYSSHISRWISEPDKGIYDAMNKGIGLATGEWLYFMGSDDFLYDDYVLENIFVKNAPADSQVIYGDVMFHSTHVYGGVFDCNRIIESNICHQSIFTKKKLFNQLGLFNPDYRILADWDFNLRWFLNNSVKKKYVNIIVANFSAGGYSSQSTDPLFLREKYDKIIEYGKNTLPNRALANVYLKKFELSYKEKAYYKSYKNFLSGFVYSGERICFLKKVVKVLLS